jgi:light-regulated signal transduction histidine kinase (bacteriophytochrome)
MHDGVVIADLKGGTILRNAAAIAQYPAEPVAQLSGEYHRGRELGIFLPDMETPMEADKLPIVRVLRGEEVDREEVFMRNRFNPEGRWLQVTARPIYSEDQKPIAGLLVFHDITVEKKSREEMRRAMEKLERSNRELNHFGYVVSHDLREPLRMIQTYLQLLTRRYTDKLEPTALEFIDFAVNGARRMQELIEALLQYSRVSPDSAKESPTDLRRALDRALSQLTDSIQETQAVIEVGDLPVVQGDESRLSIVFQNLISNALKFRREMPPRIRVGGERSGDFWQISLEDNGIGIPAEHISRLFQVFQRLHTVSEYPGTGIGLALSKKVVENHGGTIHVKSVVGQGSTFYFTLPVHPRNRARPAV